MKAGDKVKLTKDEVSGKRQLYAKRLEIVSVVSVHHSPVLLVESNAQIKFPVRIEEVIPC